MDYQTTIGLEIHVELLTESKMFCGCPVEFGGEPNTRTCPVCLGMPGSLPVINEKAVRYTFKAGLALNSKIAQFTQFHRKNYFYPDMPKNYQISQYDLPLCVGGWVEVDMSAYKRKVGITRVHLEEDTGKLVHMGQTGRISEADYSLVDFNRAGTPLMEVVTEPDLRSPEEAKAFVQMLRSTLEQLEVSDCNMQEGSLRVDANVSVGPADAKELGVKTEVKNMNSFKALEKALSYEVERQQKTLSKGGEVEQETRHFDDTRGITTPLRTKEYAHDYRYFPEPDLVPLEINKVLIEEVKATIGELPEERKNRLIQQYNIPAYDAALLTSSKELADFFEECANDHKEAKKISNWMLGELAKHLNAADLEIAQCAITPKHLVQLLKLIDDGKISGKMAKEVFEEVFNTGKLPQVIVEEKDLIQIADEDELTKIIEAVIEENPEPVEQYKQGKEQVLGFLVGQVMKLTQGKANPALVNKLLKEKL